MSLQPQSINIPLFGHQLASIDRMYELECTRQVPLNPDMLIHTQVGFLSDLGGYGKTLSVLGLVAKTLVPLESAENSVCFFEDIRYHKYVQHIELVRLIRVPCTLVLANVSLLSQWDLELKRTSLKYKIIYTRAEIDTTPTGAFDIIIVSANIFGAFVRAHPKIQWKRVVIDEPCSISG